MLDIDNIQVSVISWNADYSRAKITLKLTLKIKLMQTRYYFVELLVALFWNPIHFQLIFWQQPLQSLI